MDTQFLDDVARRAVAEYDVKDCTLTFIRHSDNVIFKVEVPDSGGFMLSGVIFLAAIVRYFSL